MSTKWKLALALITLGLGALAWSTIEQGPGEGGLAMQRDGAPILGPAESSAATVTPVPAPETTERSEANMPASSTPGPALGTARPAFPGRTAPGLGALEVRVAWAADGAAARGVNLRVHPWGGGDAFLMQRAARTDDRGMVLVEGLAPGSVGVYCDRGASAFVEVTADRTARLDLSLEAGVTVAGRVVDAAGSPVAGAVLQLSEHGNTSEGSDVGESGADGTFLVRGVLGQRMLSARAAGHAPSAQVMVEGRAEATIELELTLRGDGGALTGLVLGPSGEPLHEARVRVEPLEDPPAPAAPEDDARWIEGRALPRELVTDDGGRFVCDGLAVGRHQVEARNASDAPHLSEVVVRPGTTEDLVIRLAPGVTLTGTVRRADGRPAVGARVYQGPYGDFASHQSAVRADGAFELEGLAPGALSLRASEEGHGSARVTLDAVPGEPLRWEPTLTPGNDASGVLLDASGAPLAGWQVSACGAGGQFLTYRTTTTSEDGSFTLTDIPAPATGLAVGPSDSWTVGVALRIARALPAREPLRIVVPDERQPSARVVGVVRDTTGKVPPEAELRLVDGRTRHQRTVHPDESGRFLVDRVYPGPVSMRLEAPGRASLHRRADVPAAGTLDSGEWLLGPGGMIAVTWTPRANDPAAYELEVELLDLSGALQDSWRIAPGRNLLGPVSEGPRVLRTFGPSSALTESHLVVTSGGTSELTLAPPPGTSRIVALVDERAPSTPDPLAIPPELVVRLLDQAGHELRAFRSFTQSGPIVIDGLTVGTYTVEVTDPEGRRGATELVVQSLQPPPKSAPPAATLVLR